jgi:hypothetical protein
MADRSREIQASRPERREVLLWLPVLAGPVAWILAEQLSFMLAPTACWKGQPFMLHLVPLGTLAIAAAGAAFARSRWKGEPEGSTESGDPRESRRRFMVRFGFWSCLGFALAILATEVPNLVLKVCD